MSESDEDFSPFEEEKKNLWVWIVPSVLLHVVLLIVWMAMPEEPPRKPSQRKLTINSAQAEQLQQHVEDANLKMLHSQVSELQEIKLAMAKIRDAKMNQLRSFEEEMVVVAPADATELFQQFMAAQVLIVQNYEGLIQSVNKSEALTVSAKELIAKEDLAGAMPAMQEIDQLYSAVGRHLSIINEQFGVSFALVSTGEVQLDWILNDAITTELSNLNAAMESALAAKNTASGSIWSAYGGKAGQALDRLTQDAEKSIKTLEVYKQSLVDGQRELEKNQKELNDLIAQNEAGIAELDAQIKALNLEVKALGNAKENQQAKREVMAKSKKLTAQLNRDKRTLSGQKTKLKRLSFKPDRSLQNQVNKINAYMGNLFATQPDTTKIAAALQAQLEVTQASKALLESLAQASQGNGEEGS
ncbi:hypothetical protein P3T73_04825 [Kiritimatiellota bacterium B12222]|nr:hypothetical protein P3T73_04825 [Kiritimatiellota bacterium B12222]